jgi:hypothetical protein
MSWIYSHKIYLRIIGILALLVALGTVSRVVGAEAGVQFSDLDVIYTYGEQVTFQAKYFPVDLVKKVFLFFQPAGEDTRLVEMDLKSQGEVVYSYDLKAHYLRPFSRTEFWFQAELADGEKVESEKQAFDYIDNRQTWQSMDNGTIQVNWLKGDLFYGQDALNAAAAGARKVSSIFPGQNLAGLRIYLYGSASAMQEALNNNAASWAVGQTSPDLGIIIVSIMPGVDQQLEMDRQIPHEIMHYLLYQLVKDNYANIPMWLNEGLASISETYANPDYQQVLSKAVKDNSLLPLNSLCGSFPQDASNAFLAYAQSDSFVHFLQDKFGNNGLLALVQAYQNGYSCEDGIVTATGSSLSQLDYRWRQESLGVDTGLLAMQNMLPFILVAGILVLVPLFVAGISVFNRGKA